jgi:hypothetical protein
LELEFVSTLGALHNLRSKKNLVAEKQCEIHILSNEEKEKCTNHSVGRQTAVARMQIEDAEAAISKEQENTDTTEIVGLMTREPEKMFHKLMVAIRESLSDIASSEDRDNVEEKDDEQTEQGKLSEDDELGWVMGTISKTVEQCMEWFQEKRMRQDELIKPGWEDATYNFR